uniref:Bm14124 n=1 Tax=Brugia malayi TaxID=6279 RepID=A0A0J9XNB6_BRUMA|nr:Bm14124 [Brugia malayi]
MHTDWLSISSIFHTFSILSKQTLQRRKKAKIDRSNQIKNRNASGSPA